jgi:hypothetical protein
LNPEAEEEPLLEAVTRQLLVKTLKAGKYFAYFIKCENSDAVIIICSYDL